MIQIGLRTHHIAKMLIEKSKVIPLMGGASPLKYPVRFKLTINKYLADSHDEIIVLKMEPETRAASMIPIPAAVLRIRTDNIKESVPTTTAQTRQAQSPLR